MAVRVREVGKLSSRENLVVSLSVRTGFKEDERIAKLTLTGEHKNASFFGGI